MDEARYQEIRQDLAKLTEGGVLLSQALSGKDATQDRQFYADRIFSKLLSQAITLVNIIPTGIIPVSVGKSEFWDISSVCCITRAIIESYDALFYVSVEEIDAVEREFRFLLWHLHAEERRFKGLNLIGSTAPEVKMIENEVRRLKKEVTVHVYFKSLNTGMQKRINRGESPPYYLSQRERNDRAQVNHNYYNACLMLLSSYVHTFPFSVQQLAQFKADDMESLRLMSVPLQHSLGFISKSIDGMYDVFREALPDLPAEISDLREIWCGIVKNGV